MVLNRYSLLFQLVRFLHNLFLSAGLGLLRNIVMGNFFTLLHSAVIIIPMCRSSYAFPLEAAQKLIHQCFISKCLNIAVYPNNQ